jgi:hypothetical protein
MRNVSEDDWMPAIGVNSMTYIRPFTSEDYPLFDRMKAAGMDFCELLVPEEGELNGAEVGRAARQGTIRFGLSLFGHVAIRPLLRSRCLGAQTGV